MGEEGEGSAQSQIHMSADDLNDGFILDKHDKMTLSYQVIIADIIPVKARNVLVLFQFLNVS